MEKIIIAQALGPGLNSAMGFPSVAWLTSDMALPLLSSLWAPVGTPDPKGPLVPLHPRGLLLLEPPGGPWGCQWDALGRLS